VLGSTAALAQATDPGVRHASTDNTLTPPALPNSTPTELAFFQDGLTRSSSVKSASQGSEANQVVDNFLEPALGISRT
jgi:hypothetical protein